MGNNDQSHSVERIFEILGNVCASVDHIDFKYKQLCKNIEKIQEQNDTMREILQGMYEFHAERLNKLKVKSSYDDDTKQALQS